MGSPNSESKNVWPILVFMIGLIATTLRSLPFAVQNERPFVTLVVLRE